MKTKIIAASLLCMMILSGCGGAKATSDNKQNTKASNAVSTNKADSDKAGGTGSNSSTSPAQGKSNGNVPALNAKQKEKINKDVSGVVSSVNNAVKSIEEAAEIKLPE